MAEIASITGTDTGAEARSKLNAAITEANLVSTKSNMTVVTFTAAQNLYAGDIVQLGPKLVGVVLEAVLEDAEGEAAIDGMVINYTDVPDDLSQEVGDKIYVAAGSGALTPDNSGIMLGIVTAKVGNLFTFAVRSGGEVL